LLPGDGLALISALCLRVQPEIAIFNKRPRTFPIERIVLEVRDSEF